MQKIEWTQEYEIGIKVIDGQHKRIIDYINKLVDAEAENSTEQLSEVVDSLLDYTYSHFAFEEALMEEAGYENLNFHQQTHEKFTQRIKDLHYRFLQGENISEEIGELLKRWLLNHIREDDQSYASVVKKNIREIEKKDSGNWMKNILRFFD
jgi:hemerythrin